MKGAEGRNVLHPPSSTPGPVLMSDLSELESRATAELAGSTDVPTLRAWHSRYLGKEGEVHKAVKGVGAVAPDQRKAYGQNANRIKDTLSQAYETALSAAEERALEHSLKTEKLDITLPGRPMPRG